jgi:hypothetical protein
MRWRKYKMYLPIGIVNYFEYFVLHNGTLLLLGIIQGARGLSCYKQV